MSDEVGDDPNGKGNVPRDQWKAGEVGERYCECIKQQADNDSNDESLSLNCLTVCVAAQGKERIFQVNTEPTAVQVEQKQAKEYDCH